MADADTREHAMILDPTHADTGYPSAARRWSTVAILSVAVLLSFADRLIINLVAGEIGQQLVLDQFAISLLMGSGFALLYAFAGIPLGRLADRVNRRNLIAVGIAIWCLATIACAVALSFQQLFVARMFVGLGEAALMPAASSLITDSFPERERGRAFGFFHVGGVLGSGLALGLGAMLLASVQHGLLEDVPLLRDAPSWRNVLLLAGLPGFPLIIVILIAMQEPVRRSSRGVQSLSSVLTAALADNGRVARTCLAVGIVAAGDYGLLSWIPTALNHSYNMPLPQAGKLIGAMVAIGGLGGCLIGGLFADRLAKRAGLAARIWAMRLSYALCGASALLLIVPSPTAALAATALWVFGSVAGIVAANIVLQEAVINELRATVMALSNICSAIIGMGLGPSLVVAIAAQTPGVSVNGGLVISITILCLFCATIAFLLISWRKTPAALPALQ
ncbi:MFS transporter [soil metagenome]